MANIMYEAFDLIIERLTKAIEEKRKYKEALEYYATGNHDFGEAARKALGMEGHD